MTWRGEHYESDSGGPKLDEIVIALDEGDQPHELQQLAAPAKALGVEADRLK